MLVVTFAYKDDNYYRERHCRYLVILWPDAEVIVGSSESLHNNVGPALPPCWTVVPAPASAW